MSLQFQDLQLYAQGIPPLPENKQRVWNLIGQSKMAMDQRLQALELTIQQILPNYMAMDHPALAKAIAEYKDHHAKMISIRKSFSGFLDDAKAMCMTIEKKWDPANPANETFQLAEKREFELRESALNAANAANLKTAEEQKFKTFIVNEYHDMVSGYRLALSKIVQDAYNACLSQKTPVENVHIAATAAVGAMRMVRPRVMNKMERKYVSDAEAMKLWEGIPEPGKDGTYQKVFNEAFEAMKTKFSLYANDLANSEMALAQQQELFEKQQQQQQQQAEAERAANTLLSQATVPIVTPAGMKPITETTEIKIEDYSDEWVAKIMAAFLANFQVCMEKVRVKKKSKLDISQMAAALDAAGVKVEGVEYVTLKK